MVLSIALATPRIALASGTAFLVGQLLDVTVFNRLRREAWWQAPLAGSLLGSALDTALFFSIAFAGDPEMSALDPVRSGSPRWRCGRASRSSDFGVKVLIALLALLPYGALMSVMLPVEKP